MRATLFVLAGLAACGFSPGGQPASTGSDTVDAPGPVVDARAIDARVDPQIDAAPTCPDGDMDGDGICNSVDSWNCGPTLPVQGDASWAFVADSWTAKHTNLGGGSSAVRNNVHAHDQVPLHTDWTLIVGCLSQTCDAELQWGIDATAPRGCIVADTFAPLAQQQGNFDASFEAPDVGNTPKEIDVKLRAGHASTCSAGWYGGAPGSDSIIARLCVVP